MAVMSVTYVAYVTSVTSVTTVISVTSVIYVTSVTNVKLTTHRATTRIAPSFGRLKPRVHYTHFPYLDVGYVSYTSVTFW